MKNILTIIMICLIAALVFWAGRFFPEEPDWLDCIEFEYCPIDLSGGAKMIRI